MQSNNQDPINPENGVGKVKSKTAKFKYDFFFEEAQELKLIERKNEQGQEIRHYDIDKSLNSLYKLLPMFGVLGEGYYYVKKPFTNEKET